jgi:hypothetical protein
MSGTKGVGGSRGMAPLTVNLGARWRWLVDATPQPLCPQERKPVPIIDEPCWAPGPISAEIENRKSLAHNGARTPDLPARSDLACRMAIANFVTYRITWYNSLICQEMSWLRVPLLPLIVLHGWLNNGPSTKNCYNYRTHGQGESLQALHTYVCCWRETRIRKDWESRTHAAIYNNACVCERRVCAITHPAAAPAYDALGALSGGKTIVHYAKRKSTLNGRLHTIDSHSATQRRKTYVVKWMWFIRTQSSNTTPENGRKKNKSERCFNRSSSL